MDRETILELMEGEVASAAKSHAESLHEWLASHVNATVEEAVNEFLGASDGELEREARDLIHPAFVAAVERELATHLLSTAYGWESIVWTNMQNRYNETGEV